MGTRREAQPTEKHYQEFSHGTGGKTIRRKYNNKKGNGQKNSQIV
jgi:hypothetical protein